MDGIRDRRDGVMTTHPLHVLIRRRRRELNLTQADLAELLNVSPESVALWEAGRRRMDLARIPRLADALQIDARRLCALALAEFQPYFCACLLGNDVR